MTPHRFAGVAPTDAERRVTTPGDDLVADANVTMDRGFTVAATPAEVWPWLLQLGKGRGGWYLPRGVERLLPRRALRTIDPRWQSLAVGDVIPDYGPDGSFTVAELDPPRTLVYTSERGRARMSWSITLVAVDAGTRVHLRLRIGPVRHRSLAAVGDLFDALTVAGMAAGLRERLRGPASGVTGASSHRR